MRLARLVRQNWTCSRAIQSEPGKLSAKTNHEAIQASAIVRRFNTDFRPPKHRSDSKSNDSIRRIGQCDSNRLARMLVLRSTVESLTISGTEFTNLHVAEQIVKRPLFGALIPAVQSMQKKILGKKVAKGA